MNNLPLFVGIDYHQHTIQVCVMDQNRSILVNQAVANNAEVVFSLVAPFGSTIHAAIEACTGAANFAEELRKLGWNIELAHPGYVARMKQTPDKSDWTDAKLLADITRAGYVPKVWLAPADIRKLRDLVRYRAGLVKQRTQAKLRLRALMRQHRLTCPHGPWTIKGKGWLLQEQNVGSHLLFLFQNHFEDIDYFDKKIFQVENRMVAYMQNDDMVKRLLQQKGIGLITALTLRALIGDFTRFRTGKQLSHFCSVTPCNNSTGGKTTTSGLIRCGDDLLRQVILETAHRLIRYDGHWKRFAEHLRAERKKPCVIAAAVANRWTRRRLYQMTGRSIPVEEGTTPETKE
jgi:transposase